MAASAAVLCPVFVGCTPEEQQLSQDDADTDIPVEEEEQDVCRSSWRRMARVGRCGCSTSVKSLLSRFVPSYQ